MKISPTILRIALNKNDVIVDNMQLILVFT